MRAPLMLLFLVATAACIQTPCFDCDDNNPCTYDACVNNQCVHKPLSGPVSGCSGTGGCMEYLCADGDCLLRKVTECCGNGVCDGRETHITCLRDCQATCYDGILNQGEDDVDCGGPCTSCESPELNYLKKLGVFRLSWSASAGNYTNAIKAYNAEHNNTELKKSALKSYGEAEQVKSLFLKTKPPSTIVVLEPLFNNTLSLDLDAVHNMILYANSMEDGYRLSANRLFADSLDSDRRFVAEYNAEVNSYNTIQFKCTNYLLDEGEEGVDCGEVCRRPCEVTFNVTKIVLIRSEGAPSHLILNVSPPAINYTPQQQILLSHIDPEPDVRYESKEGNTYYSYEIDMPAYGVSEIEIMETVRLYRTQPPVKYDNKYFNSLYLIENNLSRTTDDICFRARLLKGNLTGAREVVRRIQDWLIDNIKYEYNDMEQGAEYCYIHRRGACDEHADLFISMARCVGIPARRVTGSLLNASQVRGHAWAEYYDGGWVYIDPSTKNRNQAFALDNKHITSCVGDGAYHCGVGYTYTYQKKKPRIEVDEKIYLS